MNGASGFRSVEREAVIPLGVNGTEIVRFVIKKLAAEGKTAIEEIRLRQRKNQILSLVPYWRRTRNFWPAPVKFGQFSKSKLP